MLPATIGSTYSDEKTLVMPPVKQMNAETITASHASWRSTSQRWRSTNRSVTA